MGFFTRLFQRQSAWEAKNATLELFKELYGSLASRTGATVNWKTALEVTAVLRCVQVIADGVSTVPLRIMRKSGDNRRPAEDHPLHALFHVAPNEWQDTLQFREQLAYHLALCGNAYAWINRVRGRIVELLPIEPHRVEVRREMTDYGEVSRYWVTDLDGRREEIPARDIWHLRGASWSGWFGLEPVRFARESIGLAIALEGSQARIHKNGVNTSGVYSFEGTLTDDQHKRLRTWLAQFNGGFDNAGNPLILDRAAKWTSTQMKNTDAQAIENRKFQIEEICRAAGVMPIMVGFTDKASTYASAEQMFLAHAVHTIRPHHRRWEASIRHRLLTREDREAGIYPKFMDGELLRGAAKDRGEYYARGISAGWLLRNEAREWEDLDPVDGLSEPLAPTNMVVGNPEPPAPTNAPDPQPSGDAANAGA